MSVKLKAVGRSSTLQFDQKRTRFVHQRIKGKNGVSMNAQNNLSALLVGEYKGDRLLVHQVFRRLGWKLFEARDRRRAMECLDKNSVQVVIAESDVPNWNWKRVLTDLGTGRSRRSW